MRYKKLTSNEVYKAIRKASDEKCYNIVYLINNNKTEEAISEILDRFDCNKKTAEEVTRMFKIALENLNRNV